MKNNMFQKTAFFALTAGVLAASQGVLAHTTLQTPIATEGKTVYNNATIGHGCAPASTVPNTPNSPVIANSIIFPDGTDSLVSVDGVFDEKAVVDTYIYWGGKISHIPSRDVFEKNAIEFGRQGLAGGNAVGSHSWKGDLPGNGVVGLVPIKISGAFLVTGYSVIDNIVVADGEDSCINSVKFQLAIADICKITNESGMDDHTVNLWTPAVVGSRFNGNPANPHHYNSPATFTITRDLTKFPLQPSCAGIGHDVVVAPSADQINHDLPIPGVWPKK
jgi:hypothetical protein